MHNTGTLHAVCQCCEILFADRLYGQASTDDVVQSVRRLRAERDQLRLRDRDHSRSMRQVAISLIAFHVVWSVPLLFTRVKSSAASCCYQCAVLSLTMLEDVPTVCA